MFIQHQIKVILLGAFCRGEHVPRYRDDEAGFQFGLSGRAFLRQVIT